MLDGPGLSHETPRFPNKVLGKMMWGRSGVLGKNIRVGGILKCHSLTRRFMLLRQVMRVQSNTDMVRALMPEGPPLLKERRYLRKDAAEQMWKSLQTQGWKKTRPLRGATAEP